MGVATGVVITGACLLYAALMWCLLAIVTERYDGARDKNEKKGQI